MTAYRSISLDHTYQTSEAAGARAHWRRSGGVVEVMFLDDPSSDRPAVRWPDEPMPAVAPGHIAFDPNRYPGLAEVRQLLPEYAALWAAVAEDYRDALAPERTPDCAAAQHSAFFALPAHAL